MQIRKNQGVWEMVYFVVYKCFQFGPVKILSNGKELKYTYLVLFKTPIVRILIRMFLCYWQIDSNELPTT